MKIQRESQEVAQLLNCLQCKPEDLSSEPNTRTKAGYGRE